MQSGFEQTKSTRKLTFLGAISWWSEATQIRTIALWGIFGGDFIESDGFCAVFVVECNQNFFIIEISSIHEEIYDEELARGLEQNVDVQQKNRDIRVLKLMVNKKDTFRVKEEVLLAGNQANIAQLLWKDAQLQGVETRLLDDQVSLKGEIQLFVLYEGENEDQIQWVSSRIPFSGMVDVSGCSPDMVGDIRVSILQKNVEAKPDRDGEERALQAEAVLELDLRIYEEETVPLLEDAYSLSRSCADHHCVI